MNTGWSTADGQLFDGNGARKYLTQSEIRKLLAAARRADRQTYLFCRLLQYTGARLSEALQVTPRRLDTETGRIIFRTLKRRRTVYRAVPVPTRYMNELIQFARGLGADEPLFPWCRQTAWRRLHALTEATGIEGPQATPRGWRHGFGCHAIGQGISEAAVGRWLGHANAKSTRIYVFVQGDEERALARRMW